MKQQGFPSVVHHYFLEYLPRQKGLQASTIRSYRDSLRLFLIFAADANRIGVSGLQFKHLGYTVVLDFLNNMEGRRGNSISTQRFSTHSQISSTISFSNNHCQLGNCCSRK